MQIGLFHEITDGFSGRIRTPVLDLAVMLVPNRRRTHDKQAHDKAPDWRLHIADDSLAAGLGAQIGAGWTHESEAAGQFIGVEIDCPTFDGPLHANLLSPRRSGEPYMLLWQRQARKPAAE